MCKKVYEKKKKRKEKDGEKKLCLFILGLCKCEERSKKKGGSVCKIYNFKLYFSTHTNTIHNTQNTLTQTYIQSKKEKVRVTLSGGTQKVFFFYRYVTYLFLLAIVK